MKYKHIVFDIDGTITDTERAALLGLVKAVKKWLGVDREIESLRFVMGIPGKVALAQLGFPEESLMEAMYDWEIFMREHNDLMRVFDGIETLTDVLLESGCCLGIATSKTRGQYDTDFCRFPIAKKFGVSVTADDSHRHKPTGGPLEKYMELTGAKKEEILYIGDAVYDMECAKDAGVDFALATWGAMNPQLEATYRPEKPTDLLAMME